MRDLFIAQAKRALRVVGLVILTTLALVTVFYCAALFALCLIKGCISQ